MTANLDIIIVNYNAGEQLRVCLSSIESSSKVGLELNKVVIVDNSSHDSSLDAIKNINLPLYIINNQHNNGFAKACNQGANISRSDYLLFLNPDTILSPDSLSKPIELFNMNGNRQIGIVGIQMLNNAGVVARSCARFPNAMHFYAKILGLHYLFPGPLMNYLMLDWDHLNSRVVDHVIGAFYMVRKDVFDELGGFDERFFVYLEDIDFSFRAYLSGWKAYYCSDVQAYHKGGGVSEHFMGQRLFYSLRSRIYYAFKHFNRWHGFMIMLGTISIEFMVRVTYGILKLTKNDRLDILEGYTLLWRNIPEIIKTAYNSEKE